MMMIIPLAAPPLRAAASAAADDYFANDFALAIGRNFRIGSEGAHKPQ